MKKTKEQELEEWNQYLFSTILGKKTIPELNEKLGLPKVIEEFSKVEKRTGSTKKPFVITDVYVDGKLYYNDKIVISGIKKSLIQMFPHDGIEVKYVRHPKYNPENMPKATVQEIRHII